MKKNYYKAFLFILIFSLFTSLILYSCTDDRDKGIGPIKKVEPGPPNTELISKGKLIVTRECFQCHSMDVKLVGPALKDVTKRRKAEWIMNMILNAEQMINEDPEARKLYLEHGVKMVLKTELTEEDARAILEYLRSIETKK